MPNTRLQKIISRLWQIRAETHPGQVYVVLDAARNDQIYSEVLGFDGEFCCLYRGEMAEKLAHVAPYLLKLEKEHTTAELLIESGWGDNWGVFLSSSASLRELRDHFRQFIVVYDESAKSLVFRYYDPRVLQAFLPTCDAEQLSAFFGPVDTYFLEADRGDTLIQCFFVDNKLRQEEIPLDGVIE